MGSPMGPGGGGSRRTLQSISFPKILIFQNRISAIGPKSRGTDLDSFCRLTHKVPPNVRPLTLVRF